MMEHRLVTLADQVYERLERDILSGKYARDEMLNEARLSQELGVSRTPVREALKRLEQEHFLADTNKGLRVVGISREDMLDYYEIRIEVEPNCAERAAKLITDEEISEILEALDMQQHYLDRQEESGEDCSEKIKDFDSLFHELIYRFSHSNAYYDTLLPIHKRMTKFRKASVKSTSRAKESIREHRGIVEALKAHDAALTKELMRTHIINARNSIAEADNI